MDKRAGSLAEAAADIPDGAKVMIGGFGGSGAPIELIHALIDRFLATGSPKGLTIVNNNAGNGRVGIAAMIDHGMVRKTICSFPRSTDPRAFTENISRVSSSLCHRARSPSAFAREARHPGLLHADLLRHRSRQGQTRGRIRGALLCAGALAQGGLCADQG
jgi:acyl CoA:acetate/3-ketoacid CoA transferase alpha subunit